jgi:hypothetical protein
MANYRAYLHRKQMEKLDGRVYDPPNPNIYGDPDRGWHYPKKEDAMTDTDTPRTPMYVTKKFPDGRYYTVNTERPNTPLCQYCHDSLVVPARLCPGCNATENLYIICDQIKRGLVKL